MNWASTNREIDESFAAFGRERPDALFVAGDSFFYSRRVQLATLAARERIPAAYWGIVPIDVEIGEAALLALSR